VTGLTLAFCLAFCLQVESLSGGERRRLHLAAVLASAPNVLILDEPTNDLDLTTIEVLEEMLQVGLGCFGFDA
jgi:ATP-binding cassette subfamily F protein uup